MARMGDAPFPSQVCTRMYRDDELSSASQEERLESMQDCAPSVTAFASVEKDAAPQQEREPVSAAAAVRTDIVFSC
ncbi:hypothetical protein MOC99_19270 [Bacillus haynesii]|uniref:hypothetical protein n=1 Tax=Bacillus haynesii TaxID=1925021 RepID=UPI0022808B22|nr:hypothetical protein [Bacillus haynesii]MCY8348053.1 hypothetical protein [Bacillus haynesii]MCY8351944.1 hypothetical protein [Bacillus haynesii]